jgi:hypothetical protein
MVVAPAAMPVTYPEVESIVATEAAALRHKPPATALVSVVPEATQTPEAPDIDGTNGTVPTTNKVVADALPQILEAV